jgi:2,3-bisphosphoglycerate-dependent phosphoglycerate mutase
LLRHGESTANADDVFGGWLDYPFTARGRTQASEAGRLIHDAGLDPAAVHTSLLTRAVDTAEIVLAESTSPTTAVHRSWLLNERHYGALQGRSRAAIRAEFGDELFGRWRRSYEAIRATPKCPRTSCRPPNHSPTYARDCSPTGGTRSSPTWPPTESPSLSRTATHFEHCA